MLSTKLNLILESIGVVMTYLDNLFFRQLRGVVGFSWVRNRSVPSLRHHILSVVVLGALKQVCGVAARRVVAAVQNALLWIEISIVDKKRDSMRSLLLAIKPKNSISELSLPSDPIPTIIRSSLNDFGPKPVELISPPYLQHPSGMFGASILCGTMSGCTALGPKDSSSFRYSIHENRILKR